MSAHATCLALDGALKPPCATLEVERTGGNDATPIATLTRAMVAGEDAAYRQFYEIYAPRLRRYLLVMTRGDEEAAREALQAACVRVVRHIKVFGDEQMFWNWLALLARSAFLDQSRTRRRYFSFLDRFTRHSRPNAPVPENGEADSRLIELLHANLASLTAEERELVEQKYFQRCSVREIALAAQCSEKAVESRLSRVRQKLKAAVLAGLKHEPAN